MSFCPWLKTVLQSRLKVGVCSLDPVSSNSLFSVIAYTTWPIFAQYMAPAHIAHGSAEVYRVQFQRNDFGYRTEARSARVVSACPVHFLVVISIFSCSRSIFPSPSTSMAPKGVFPFSLLLFETSMALFR